MVPKVTPVTSENPHSPNSQRAFPFKCLHPSVHGHGRLFAYRYVIGDQYLSPKLVNSAHSKICLYVLVNRCANPTLRFSSEFVLRAKTKAGWYSSLGHLFRPAMSKGGLASCCRRKASCTTSLNLGSPNSLSIILSVLSSSF